MHLTTEDQFQEVQYKNQVYILIQTKDHKIPDILLEEYKNNSVKLVEMTETDGISTTKILQKIRKNN